jgi:alpha-L-fucosidase
MNLKTQLAAVAGLFLLLPPAFVPAGEGQPAQSNVANAPSAAVEHWRSLKFGLFIHWGPVSLRGTEIGHSRGTLVPIEEYDALHKQFNPVKFNADEWVRLAKQAGMKYMVPIARHHDGFCMFDTKLTDYNIMRGRFGRDPLKELAEACRRQGIDFGAYLSVADWWHPDFPLGSPKGFTRKPNANMDRYERYFLGQIRELLGNYGPLLTIWFDYPQEFDARRGSRAMQLIRSLQPDVMVNDRLASPMGKAIPGDYDTPEQKLGGMQTHRPWETCMTLGTQWSWKPDDRIKSLKECIHALVGAVGGDGNLLLNVGPMPDGQIEPRQAARLREIGAWLEKYGESIYATRGGPFERGRWGAATYKGNTIYLHLLDPTLDVVKLAPLRRKIVDCRVLSGGKAEVKQSDAALEVSVPKSARQEIDTIVALELDGPAADARVPLWDMEKLSVPPQIVAVDPEREQGEIKAIFFEGLPWRDMPTRVFAYYAIPKVEHGKKVPAMVLVHGGGGSASAAWLKLWLDRGYAAISVDTCGNQPGDSRGAAGDKPINYARHAHAGPPGWGGFDQTSWPVHDQWTFHAVADAILAHSLIRSMPEVDAERVGLTGVSWGGYLASIVAGVDQRLRFVAPVYGCGFFNPAAPWPGEFQKIGPVETNYWLGLWEPAVYLRDARMPMLWVSGTNDFAFSLESLQESYRLPRAERTLAIRVRMPHSQEAATSAPEIFAFADAMLRGGQPLAEVDISRRRGLEVGARVKSAAPIEKVELIYTLDSGPWQERKWQAAEARFDPATGTASASLPPSAAAYFFNVFDSRGLVSSSEHFRVINVSPQPPTP